MLNTYNKLDLNINDTVTFCKKFSPLHLPTNRPVLPNPRRVVDNLLSIIALAKRDRFLRK